MILKNKNFVIVKYIFILCNIVFLNVNIFSISVLDKKYNNYFSKNDFLNFPNWKVGFNFSSSENLIESDLYLFENTDDVEIKFSYLPRIPVSEDLLEENSMYKYQEDFQMRFFKSEESLVSIHKNPLGQTTRVYKENSLVKQKIYDEKERVFSQKIWKNDSEKYNLILEKKYEYNFFEDKYPAKIETVFYDVKNLMIEFFNQNNFVTKIEIYNVEFSENNIDDKKLLSCEYLNYDSENRVIEKILEKNDSVVKVLFDYSKGLKNPDEIVFENNNKVSEKKFVSDFDYSYTLYLDENYSVKSEYKNSIKVVEDIYLNGKKIRTSKGAFHE